MTRAFLILGSLLIVAVLALNPQWLKVEHVRVQLIAGSIEKTLFERIRQTLEPRLREVEGRFFWNAPLGPLLEMAEEDKRVKRVAIYREFPSRLRVEIEPRTPVLSYLSGDGHVYPIASDATLLPSLPLREMPDLPLVRGIELKTDPRLRATALELYQDIPDHGVLSKNQIGEIFYDPQDGFKIYLGGLGAEVRVGDSQFAGRLGRVARVLSYLDSQSVKGRVIDARFAKKVVVRPRKAP